MVVRDTPIETPDLAIYSQDEAVATGIPPTWDSPDMVTNEWRPFRLMPEARVWVSNLSPSTPAINALVHYYTSSFGIGTRRQLQLTRSVTIAPSQRVELLFPLPQEVLTGDPRVGVHIRIEHPFDRRRVNNSGSQVHDGGYTTESGRVFDVAIPVMNDSGVPRRIGLSVLPTDLLATITPAFHDFAGWEQIVARLHVEVPSFLTGAPGSEIARSVTVVGRLLPSGELIGGATRLLRVDN